MDRIVTCIAPVNIAVIKYWGKQDDILIIPLNDSISFTLSKDEMCAKTTVMISPKFKQDRFWLNHQEETIDNPRIFNCLKEVRRRASKRKEEGQDVSFIHWHVHIYSVNNFPTAAGLASSAAGYACLVYALGKIFELEGDLSTIARLGSGSACRSLYGGMVKWFKGSSDDGSDSLSRKIANKDYWGDLRIIICVANDGRKKVSSTEGMKRSIATSFLMKCRIRESVEHRMQLLLKAIDKKDWSTFCDLTMADSNEMHAVCLDSFPPCVYMNDTSHAIAALVHQYNNIMTTLNKIENKVCYTFDAGPNACLFVPSKVVTEFSSILNECFLKQSSYNNTDVNYWQGMPSTITAPQAIFRELVMENRQARHSIKYFIHTKVGDGPKVLDNNDGSVHLLDRETGLPKVNKEILNTSRSSVIKSTNMELSSSKVNNPKVSYASSSDTGS